MMNAKNIEIFMNVGAAARNLAFTGLFGVVTWTAANIAYGLWSGEAGLPSGAWIVFVAGYLCAALVNGVEAAVTHRADAVVYSDGRERGLRDAAELIQKVAARAEAEFGATDASDAGRVYVYAINELIENRRRKDAAHD